MSHGSLIKTLILTISFLILTGFSWGGDKPKEAELRNACSLQIPAYMKITSFVIEAMQNYGNDVEPRWRSRFRATIEASDNLYGHASTENGVTFVSLVTQKEKRTNIFGKTTSVLYEGAWRHVIEIDGNPTGNLGAPLTHLSGRRIIVRGSNDERNYYAELEQKKSELRNNIVNAKKIIVGTWRDNNSLLVFEDNGSMHIRYDSGQESIREWLIEGDILTVKGVKFKDQNGDWKKEDGGYTGKIIYIDSNSYRLEISNQIWTSRRIK